MEPRTYQNALLVASILRGDSKRAVERGWSLGLNMCLYLPNLLTNFGASKKRSTT